MLQLPESTYFGKRIPKQKFYENLSISPALKRSFIDEISGIIWQHKIAHTTVNIAPGKNVTELEVIEIRLNQPSINVAILQQIDKELPYHVLFILSHNGKAQAWISYKQVSGAATQAFKVNQYYHTNWMLEEELPLKLEGLNVDAVYENFVYQIAGDALQANKHESLQDAVARDEKVKNLQKQIDTLQAKIRKEKQLNVQIKLNSELKVRKKELEEIL